METIAALSTAPGAAGLGVIRISGEDAYGILARVFRTKSKILPRKMYYGTLHNASGDIIDRPMAVYFAGPHSFTGEDTCEIHCHGSPALLSMALEAVYAAGARPARPGEYTKRAFLNGKLDLVEAEATGELIAAETEAAVRNAAALLGGALGRSIGGVYDTVIDLVSRFRAVADYPEEDIEEQELPDMCNVLRESAAKLANLIERSRTARAFTHGIDAAIVGRPNAGKSSLLNLLCGEDRAIVTPLAGTTRDVVETRATLGGVPIRLMDTAGIRSTEDIIEAEGVNRAERAAKNATLALMVLDASTPLESDDIRAFEASKCAEKVIIIQNKCDLCTGEPFDIECDADIPRVRMSAVTGEGAEALSAAVRGMFDAGGLRFNGDVVTSARQLAALDAAAAALTRTADALEAGYPADMALTDAEYALDRLSELFGKKASDEVVDRIFEHFCVGK